VITGLDDSDSAARECGEINHQKSAKCWDAKNGVILPRNDWEGDAPERNDAFEMPEGVYGQPKE